jgi:hypothetical protein
MSRTFQVECPTGSGDYMNLVGVAEEVQHRIIHIFSRDMEGRRATNGGNPKLDRDPHFRDYVWFYEVDDTTIILRRFPIVICISVLPCRYRSWTWCITPDWLVSSFSEPLGLFGPVLKQVVGLASSRFTFFKAASAVVCRRPQEVTPATFCPFSYY